jgi:type IV pilus assembly protein PilE
LIITANQKMAYDLRIWNVQCYCLLQQKEVNYMKNKGFTLIEIMIVVAIIGTLAAIAIPNLSEYLNKSKRTDGIVALNGLLQAQAKLRTNCATYAQTLVSTATNCASSELKYSTTSEEGRYTIAITDGTATGNAYTSTATVVGNSDTECKVLVLTVNPANPNGLKGSTDGTNPTTGCW